MDKALAFVTYLEGHWGRRFTHSGYYYKTECPFHNERTASFYVDERDGHGYCFGGCDESTAYCRDVIEAIYRLEFSGDKNRARAFERARTLGFASGDTPRPYLPRALPRPSQTQIEAMTIAFEKYHEFLVRRTGRIAREWLTETRGLQGEYLELALLSVGYAPDGGQYHAEVCAHLKEYFGNEWRDRALEAGIISIHGRQRLRSRIIFAAREGGEIGGPVLFYQGRTIVDSPYKHLNAPGIRKAPYIPIFSAEDQPRPGTWITEGPMDALAYAVNGFFSVGVMGDRLPPAEVLRKFPSPIFPSMDQDDGREQSAGPKAQCNLIAILQENAIPFVTPLRSRIGKDPSEWLQHEGPERFTHANILAIAA